MTRWTTPPATMASMQSETTVDIDAPVETVWNVLMDVESWPRLTESMTRVERLDAGPLRVGMRVRIHQPKLPPATWKVTELVENERFVWRARGPGFHTVASHEVTSIGDASRLRLTVEQSGLMGGVVGRLGRDLTERYIALEAAGIKRRAEESR
jgi:uncharacterized membrane protein